MKKYIFFIILNLWNVLAIANDNPKHSFHRDKLSEQDSLVNQELLQLRSRIERIYFGADTIEMNLLLDKTIKISKTEIKNWHINYYAGFLHDCLGKFYRDKDDDKAYNHFEASVSFLHKAEAINQNPELAILLSSAYGKMASLSFFSALSLGKKSQEYLNKALQMNNAKRSVKICLVEASHFMFTPPLFGGDKKRAKELLDKAVLLNNLEVESKSLLINWAGEAEILARFAQLYFEEEKYQLAREYCNKTLKTQPNNAFIRYELLPQIDLEDQ